VFFGPSTFYYIPEEGGCHSLKDTRNEMKKVEQEIDGLAAQYVMSSGISSNRKLVERIWNKLDEKKKQTWKGLARPSKYSWQRVNPSLMVVDLSREEGFHAAGQPTSEVGRSLDE